MRRTDLAKPFRRHDPKRIYELLGRGFGRSARLAKVHLFWGDERFVPMDHQDSNYRMARKLSSTKCGSVFSGSPDFDGARTPEIAAALYEETLQSFYGSKILDPERPLFDVTLLGLGEDGHTASLFPGTKALDERNAWYSDHWAKPEPRISLTYPALESSGMICLSCPARKNGIFSRAFLQMT